MKNSTDKLKKDQILNQTTKNTLLHLQIATGKRGTQE